MTTLPPLAAAILAILAVVLAFIIYCYGCEWRDRRMRR